MDGQWGGGDGGMIPNQMGQGMGQGQMGQGHMGQNQMGTQGHMASGQAVGQPGGDVYGAGNLMQAGDGWRAQLKKDRRELLVKKM